MQIIATIFPVFAIALTGYLTTQFGVFKESDIKGLSRFVFNLAIPILLFNSLSNLDLPTNINWQFFLSYYLVVFFIYGLTVGIGRSQFSLTARQQGVYGMGATQSNLVLVGIPIITVGLGERALLPLFTIISIHSATIFFIATIVTERGQDPSQNGHSIGRRLLAAGLRTLRSLARNPIIIGLVLGLTFNRLPPILPEMVTDTLQIFGRASLPCALFVLGASLSIFRASAAKTESEPASKSNGRNNLAAETAVLVGFKLLLHPLLVYLLAFHLFTIDPLWATVAVMAAGMPIGINAYMFAEKYQECLQVVGTAVLLSTLLAAATQTMLLALFVERL
jgi:predicted permease